MNKSILMALMLFAAGSAIANHPTLDQNIFDAALAILTEAKNNGDPTKDLDINQQYRGKNCTPRRTER